MASIKVTYVQTRTLTQTIDWPEDEMEDFNPDNLECNLEPEDSREDHSELYLVKVLKDGEIHEF